MNVFLQTLWYFVKDKAIEMQNMIRTVIQKSVQQIQKYIFIQYLAYVALLVESIHKRATTHD